MDSHSQSTSFLNLLNSQQDNHILQPNQFESYSPSIGLGSSEVPVFSTQCSDDPSLSDHTTENRKRRRKWSPTEDVVLISAWLNTNKDPVIGNEQKTTAFWKCITAYYAASPKLAGQKREPDHCKQRWRKINERVKFVGSYEAACKEKSSGQNDNDVMKLANQIFLNDYKVRFNLEHAWRELRHDQKWCGSAQSKDSGSSKRRKLNEQSAQSSTSVPLSHEAMARPPGVKASKKKDKPSMSKEKTVEEEGKALSEFQSMWEIKKKDFELKEKFMKHKMLESLIAKTELSDIEIALKNKLITDMLSNA